MDKLTLELDIDDTNLILEALGQLPFARVYQLIGRLQEQARQQIRPTPERRDEAGSAAHVQ